MKTDEHEKNQETKRPQKKMNPRGYFMAAQSPANDSILPVWNEHTAASHWQ